MEKDWGTVLIQNWGPMLILVVVWVYFMRRYGRGGGRTGVWQEYFTRHKEHMGRVEAQLDRIAAALELVAKR